MLVKRPNRFLQARFRQAKINDKQEIHEFNITEDSTPSYEETLETDRVEELDSRYD